MNKKRMRECREEENGTLQQERHKILYTNLVYLLTPPHFYMNRKLHFTANQMGTVEQN